MTPAQLLAEDFVGYSAASRTLVQRYLPLLRRLPLAICPFYLLQMRQFETSFPAEKDTLTQQADALGALSAEEFSRLTDPLRQITVSAALEQGDWINDPAAFVSGLTAYLWSSGQIDRFREGTRKLFAALPILQDDTSRLTVVVLGKDAVMPAIPFRTLRKHGTLLTNVQDAIMLPQQLLTLLQERAAADPLPYAHWYVDGGLPWATAHNPAHATSISYPELLSLRTRVLGRMKETIVSGDAGAEAMRTQLSTLRPEDLGADRITADPVLQRFYTELFTLSSGPQIFSTSFVQWTGREIARRARPRTMLLRYSPRQHHRLFNEMIEDIEAEKTLDPEGSLRDAEMGAYYALLEMKRISGEGKSTLLAWLEASRTLLVVSHAAPQGALSNTTMTLQQALRSFT